MRVIAQLTAVLAIILAGCPATSVDHETTPIDAGRDGAPGPREGGFPDPPRPVDAGPDARPDAPGGFCTVGMPCNSDRGCVRGECIPENRTEVTDWCAIEPEPAVYWREGYCVEQLPTMADLEGCDPLDRSTCPECSRCIYVGGGQSMCMASCELTATTRGGCRDGYECQFGDAVCTPGCLSDSQCRIFREDSNMDGVIDPTSGLDHLTCDRDSLAVCNPITFRCDQPSGGGAAGSACDRTSLCEANGSCFAGWPNGGYCSKLGCEIPGRECEGEGKCQSRRIGLDVCGQACRVWEEDETPLEIGPTGHATDCREGYACAWDGASPAGEGNGICVPGNYNGVTVPNVGAPCDPVSEEAWDCWSPFGAGYCLGGVCSVLDCAAPGAPADVCGPAGACVVFLQSGSGVVDLGACLPTCAVAEDCAPGNACVPRAALDSTTDPGRVCFPGCAGPRDCRAGERCAFGAPGTLGSCAPL